MMRTFGRYVTCAYPEPCAARAGCLTAGAGVFVSALDAVALGGLALLQPTATIRELRAAKIARQYVIARMRSIDFSFQGNIGPVS
jgi:hypothetical protein